MDLDDLMYNALKREIDFKRFAEANRGTKEGQIYKELAEEQNQLYGILKEYKELREESSRNSRGYWGEYG